EQGGVVAAPAPARIIEKGLVSDRVVIDAVISKYSDHLPLYRQSAMLERETGLEISRATMDGWVMRVGELLIPVTVAMGRELVAVIGAPTRILFALRWSRGSFETNCAQERIQIVADALVQ